MRGADTVTRSVFPNSGPKTHPDIRPSGCATTDDERAAPEPCVLTAQYHQVEGHAARGQATVFSRRASPARYLVPKMRSRRQNWLHRHPMPPECQ